MRLVDDQRRRRRVERGLPGRGPVGGCARDKRAEDQQPPPPVADLQQLVHAQVHAVAPGQACAVAAVPDSVGADDLGLMPRAAMIAPSLHLPSARGAAGPAVRAPRLPNRTRRERLRPDRIGGAGPAGRDGRPESIAATMVRPGSRARTRVSPPVCASLNSRATRRLPPEVRLGRSVGAVKTGSPGRRADGPRGRPLTRSLARHDRNEDPGRRDRPRAIARRNAI
jgi:hypothetical protein